MRKRILSILLAILMILPSLTACHGSKSMEDFVLPDSFDENKKITITFWAKNDTNMSQVNVYKRAISEFESYYPNITVDLKLYTDYTKIYNDVITNIATSTTPNVCITYPDHIATYITGNAIIAKLDELIVDEKYGLGGSEVRFDGPDEIVEKFLNECYVDGNLYAVPYMRSTEALYVNVDMVKKLGYEMPEVVTWDFIWEVSDKAMEKNEDGTYKVNGQNVLIPFIYKSTDNMMIQMLAQKGAGYSTAEGDVLLFNDTTRDILKEIKLHCDTKSFSTFKISSYPGNYLNAGQCIFAVDSTAGATWMGSEAAHQDISSDNIVHFNIAVTAIPQYDPESPKMISQGPSVCIFNKEDTDEVIASWLFVQYLLSDSVQIEYSQTEGYVPVTVDAQTSEEYLDYLSREGEDNDLYYSTKIQATKLLLDNIDNTFITNVFNGSASLRDAAGDLIESICTGVRKKKTIDDDFITNLYSEEVSLYHLDQIGSGAKEKTDLGPLPTGSKVLITTLVIVWTVLLVSYIYSRIKDKKTIKK